MKTILIQITSFTLLAGAMAFAPMQAQAQTVTNAPAKTEVPPKHGAHLRGKITAIDKTAMTITVEGKAYKVNSQTLFYKNDKPATLEDFAVGDEVQGSHNTSGEGKLLMRLKLVKAEGGAPAEPPVKK